MTDRRRRILALLWSLSDLEPAPKSSWGATKSGPGPARKVPCTDCGGLELTDDEGRRLKARKGSGMQPAVLDQFGREKTPAMPCPTCGGNESPGWIFVDRMVGSQQVRTGESLPTRPARMVTCDACEGTGVGGAHLRDPEDPASEYREPCRYCQGSGKRAVTVKVRANDGDEAEAPDDLIALDVSLARLREQGGYDDLVYALDLVAKTHPKAHQALVAAHVEHTAQPTPGSFDATLVEFGLLCLERRMPEKIRVPAQVWKAWKTWQERQGRTLAHGAGAGGERLERRDKEIRRLVREGKPSQWIAAEYGLSPSQVDRIARGETEAA